MTIGAAFAILFCAALLALIGGAATGTARAQRGRRPGGALRGPLAARRLSEALHPGAPSRRRRNPRHLSKSRVSGPSRLASPGTRRGETASIHAASGSPFPTVLRLRRSGSGPRSARPSSRRSRSADGSRARHERIDAARSPSPRMPRPRRPRRRPPRSLRWRAAAATPARSSIGRASRCARTSPRRSTGWRARRRRRGSR